LKQKIKRLKRAQRKMCRRKKGSKNRDKARRQVAKIHARVADSRKDFLHKISCAVAKNQDYTAVAIEDLAVANMVKNHRLARHIMDAGWRTFRDFLAYKCEREGKTLLTIGRFEPSSKLCSCGTLNNALTLRDRVWTCASCGTTHDRDVLAANNIVRFAFCKQDTSNKISASAQAAAKIPLERRKLKPVERPVRGAAKQEAASL
jgi:putative transposase